MMRATALGATSGLTATTVLNNPAWVDTDLDDYPPGATVYITGSLARPSNCRFCASDLSLPTARMNQVT